MPVLNSLVAGVAATGHGQAVTTRPAENNANGGTSSMRACAGIHLCPNIMRSLLSGNRQAGPYSGPHAQGCGTRRLRFSPLGGLQRVFSIGRCYSLSSLPRPCPRFRLAGGWGLAGTLTAGVCCWRRNPACMPACGFTRAFSQCIFRTAQGAPGPGKPRPDHQRIVARRREHVW